MIDVLLQLHPAIPIDLPTPVALVAPLKPPILVPPIPTRKKGLLRRHPYKSGSAGTFTVHMLVWALNHMYVPVDRKSNSLLNF